MDDFYSDLDRDIDLERAAYRAEDEAAAELAEDEEHDEPEHDDDVDGALREVRRG